MPDRVILLGLDIKMFYGGPKEAVMHAIYRQNFGFTDIIIGRKHADAPYHDGTPIWGDFDAQEIFDHLKGDLQIKPLKVGFAAYYESLGRVDLMENHPDEKPVFISGKEVRKCLLEGQPVDPRIMRQTTAKILSQAMASKEFYFVAADETRIEHGEEGPVTSKSKTINRCLSVFHPRSIRGY